MRDTGGDWTRRHARLDANEDSEGSEDREESDRSERVVKAEPPAEDWEIRHAWCER